MGAAASWTFVPIKRRSGETCYAFVDCDTRERFADEPWCVVDMNGSRYLQIGRNKQAHRRILDLDKNDRRIVKHRNGNPLDNRRCNLTFPEDERWIEEDRGYSTPCWIWQLSCNQGGYGKLRVVDKDRSVLAHRFVWQERRGPIPEGLTLDHLCQVKECVNPDHLEPVTRAENIRRAARAAKA